MPDVVIGPTLPPTASEPLYPSYFTKPEAPSADCEPVLRMPQAMRLPSYACTMNARPTRLDEGAPVSTVTVADAVPSDAEVYAIDVHGSVVTAPV